MATGPIARWLFRFLYCYSLLFSYARQTARLGAAALMESGAGDLLPREESNEGSAPPHLAPPVAPPLKIQVRVRYLLYGFTVLLLLAVFKMAISEHPGVTLRDYSLEVLSFFMEEIGVALVVAFFVAYLIELRVRVQEMKQREKERIEDGERKRQEADEAERRRQVIARDVIEGVYGIQHKPSYVKAVLETNLQSMIVRDLIELEYALSELTPEQVEILGVEDASRFVMLTMLTSYTLRNVSSGPRPVNIRYSLPVRGGEGAKKLTKVDMMKIGTDVYSGDAVTQRLETPAHDNDKTYCWPKTLPGNGEIYVSVSAAALKERSDSEVCGFFYPATDGVRVRFEALPAMTSGLRPLTNSKIEADRDKGLVKTWIGTGPVLTNDSVVFWWRVPEDEGGAVAVNPEIATPEERGDHDARSLD